MKRTDEDLIAVRNLPPGIVEPSEEALARIWARISTEPAPRRLMWQQRLRPFWVPLAAAAAVLLVVGIGLAILRPHTIAEPQPQPFSSDPAQVRRVFDGLIAAARTAAPYRPRAGQLIYQDNRHISSSRLDGKLYEGRTENWIEPATTLHIATYQEGVTRKDGLDQNRAEENARNPRPSSGPDRRPYLKLTSFLAGPIDPAQARRDFIDRVPNDTAVSEDEQVWAEIYQMVVLDPLIPVDRRIALYQVLADLPVSVGETGVDGRRLVVVRFVALSGIFPGGSGQNKLTDLLFDPATGRIAGTQALWNGPVPVPSPSPLKVRVIPRPSGSYQVQNPPRPVSPGSVDPALIRRDLYHFGLVEDIGERP